MTVKPASLPWRRAAVLSLFLCLVSGLLAAPPQDNRKQDSQSATAAKQGRADAYYHYAMAHLYQQLAMQYVRQEYLQRSLDEYKAAIELDPQSDYLRMELMDLYARTNRLDDAVTEAQKILQQNPKNVEVRRRLGLIYHRYAFGGGRQIDQSLLQSAIQQYEKILEIDPKDSDSLLQLASLYRAARDPEQAEKALKKLLEAEPNSAEALASLAQLYLETGDPVRAIEALEKVKEEGRADREELLLLGEAYERAGEHKKAAEIFAEVVEQGGNTLPARRSLASNLVLAGEYDAALENYQTLIEAEPQNPENYLRLSQIFREKRRFQEARESLRKAGELAPDSLEIKYNLVLLLEREGKSDEAIQAMEQLLADTAKDEYSPQERKNRTLFYEQLGVLQRAQDRFSEADKAFRGMAEADPSSRPRALAHIIDTYRMARDYDRALKESEAAFKEFPDDRTLASLRATVLAETGDAEKGAKLLKNMLQSNDQDREIYLALAQVYEKGKMFPEAIAAVEKAQDLAKTEGERLGALFSYGSVLERAKRYPEAEAKFKQVLESEPNHASALNYLGYMLADLGTRLDEAHDLIQKALDLDPDNGAYLDSLGWLYYRQEKFDLAERYLLRSVEQFKRDPVVHTHLGDVYYKLGKIERAKKHWERSLMEWQRSAKSDQDPVEIAKVRKKLSEAETKLSSQAQSEEIKQ